MPKERLKTLRFRAGHRRQRLGQKLMVALMEAARANGLPVIGGEVLSNNHKMLKLMARLGFAIKTSEKDSGIMKVSKPL